MTCKKCKNCFHSFFGEEGENSRYIMRFKENRDCYDSLGLLDCELCYETVQNSWLYNVQFAVFCQNCRDSQYLDSCAGCRDCFGCVGLRKKEFCILNKQYTESEYQRLREKIITKMKQDEEYGEFFPEEMALTEYSQTLANWYFPRVKKIFDKKRPFNTVGPEIKFYQEKNLPLPRYHPDIRNYERFQQLAGIIPYEVSCFQCQKKITTYYPPRFGYQKIACQKCYERVIY